MLAVSRNSFNARFNGESLINPSLKIPPHFKRALHYLVNYVTPPRDDAVLARPWNPHRYSANCGRTKNANPLSVSGYRFSIKYSFIFCRIVLIALTRTCRFTLFCITYIVMYAAVLSFDG